jgi:glyoxylase-like metal-dependent hydrolase (beta-lactamase superfamily II)
LNVGRFELHSISDGTFRLDGGAMFGVVPKVLWERQEAPDDKNRIRLGLGCLLVKTPRGKWVLVDTGLSDKYDKDPKFLKIYGVERSSTLFDALKARGLSPSDVSVVINTHLHFDHCGGNTRLEGGKLVPAFPRAKYIIQKDEWYDATHPHERNQASYLPENFACLEEAGVLQLVDGEFELEPGFKVIRSGGHTRGHQCALIEQDGGAALFLGDLVPTRSHVPLPWVMSYDLYPVDSLEAKRRLLRLAEERRWTLLFQHDPRGMAGTLEKVDGRTFVRPLEAA